MKSFILCFVLLTALISGCASVSVSNTTVAKVAASDLRCRESKIKIKKITDNNFLAIGCGKRQSYVCSGSNFMTAGSCFKNGAAE